MSEEWTPQERMIIREMAFEDFKRRLTPIAAQSIAFARINGGLKTGEPLKHTFEAVRMQERRDVGQFENPEMPRAEVLDAKHHLEQSMLFGDVEGGR